MSAAGDVVETLVRERDRIGLDHVFQPFPTPFPGHTTYFENIGKISRKAQSKRNINRKASIVDELKLFIADALPEKFGSQHMKRPAREDYFSISRNVHVGKIHREQ